jgi:DNA-binding SARP family transcriptional activator/DNA-binding beta-propeller fold protein YncE
MSDAAKSDFNHESGFAFRLLGSLEISVNGQPRELPRRKQRLLLTLLLLSDVVVSIDRLVDQLWGGHPPKTAVGSLQNLVSEIRKVLGSSVIRTQGAGYSLGVPRESVDVHRFERLVSEAGNEEGAKGRAQRLREALALWRGPPLVEFAAEPFAQVEIARLHELRIVAREELAEAELELGHHARLVGELEALIIEQPLRERLRAQLMIALYRSGRQAEALKAYRDARRMLADELGLEPSEELQQLERAILTQDRSIVGARHPEETQGLAPTPPSLRAPRRGRTLRPFTVAAGVGAVVLAAAIAVVTFKVTQDSGGLTVAPNSVAIVDVQTNRVVGDVLLGGRPVAIVFGEGGVWVANADDSKVSRIDPETRKVTGEIRVGADIRDLTTGFGSIWVADGKEGTVTRIERRLDKTTLRLARRSEGFPPPVSYIAAGAGAVWATRGNTLLQIDPADNEVVARTPIPTPTGLAAGLGAAWVVTDDHRLLQVFPGRKTKVVEKASLSHRGHAPTIGAGSIWLIVDRDTGEIWRVDPESGAVRVIEHSGRYPLDLVVADARGYVWTVDSNGAIIRINPNIGLAVDEIRPGSTIQTAIAVGAGRVWVAIQE